MSANATRQLSRGPENDAVKSDRVPAKQGTPSPVELSALWAAWGDALGFPTELTSPGQTLQSRLGSNEVSVPIAWKRRIGGRFGVETELPTGAYSDDTQLRLCVSRSIRAAGRFDVESFSKIELPVFLSYGLGVGRGTRQAATALTHRSTRWNSNFFVQAGQRYVEGGGNGAAMRIQPHVWAAADHRAERYLPGLLRDVVCTHGHPRGILGAAWHALALGAAIRERAVPGPGSWAEMASTLARIPTRFEADEPLRDRWLSSWQTEAGTSFAKGCEDVARECVELVEAATRLRRGGTLEERYGELSAALGGLNPQTRGSATISAMLSLWLAWAAEGDALLALRVAANLRGSDTDTVGTMTGALLGAVAQAPPPGELQDAEHIASEARRLDAIRKGESTTDFPHPDPLAWKPPRVQSDALGLDAEGALLLAGLGGCEPLGQELVGSGKTPGRWQWVRTSYGQTLCVKRREQLVPLPAEALPRPRKPSAPSSQTTAPSPPAAASPKTVEDALQVAAAGDFDEQLVGRLLLQLSRSEHGPEKAGVFGALLARAISPASDR